MEEFEVLSVTFELDVRLCQLQLTSFDRFFDLSTLTRFTVLVNGGNTVRQQLEEHADTLSPEFREKLVLLDPAELFPGDLNTRRGQQILKVIFARRVETSHYLVLDSKNHLLRPASARDWFDEKGRARTRFAPPYAMMSKLLAASYEAFDLDLDPQSPAMPTITPYLMVTEEVRALIREIRERTGTNFVRAFRRHYPQVGEFFLYYAFLLHRYGTVDHLYHDAPRNCITLFTVWPQDPDVVRAELAELSAPEIQFFGLHRNRLRQLDAEQREAIAAVWSGAGLLAARPASYYLTPLG